MFKIGSRVKRKPEHVSEWWKKICDDNAISINSILTVTDESGLMHVREIDQPLQASKMELANNYIEITKNYV